MVSVEFAGWNTPVILVASPSGVCGGTKSSISSREGSEWRVVHRHADPLVHGISLEQLAALARG